MGPKLTPWMKLARTGEVITQGNRINVRTEDCQGVTIVSLQALAPEALDPECGAGIDVTELGDLAGCMADYRHSEYWCRPAFFKDLSQMPEETQGLLYQKADGTFGVVLPMVSKLYKCVLAGNPRGGFSAQLFSWYPGMNQCDAPAFAWLEGEDPFAMLEACTQQALAYLGHECLPRMERQYPPVLEYLGWCSWDAMQIRVSEEGLLQKCQEFQDKGIPVRWALLDDMWAEIHTFYGARYDDFGDMVQLMHASPMYDWEADPVRFPHGLKGCIDRMKALGLDIGVWHPTTGYWRGIDPEGTLFTRLQDVLYQTKDGRYIHSPEFEKAFAFYHSFHSFLKHCGADFVKIDNQSMIRRFYKGAGPVGKVARDVHMAMEASTGVHFGQQLINCMGMASEDMWNRPASAVSRCSDDFLPENKEWFTKHILQCAFNSLIQGQFYTCDWDMWWTDDGQAVKNSVLRAISGGPIYISDPLERSRKEILDPLVLSDGRILRCNRPAMPMKQSLVQDPREIAQPLFLQNMADSSGIAAAFHLFEGEGAVRGSFCPGDIPGLCGDSFVVYEHFSGQWQMAGRDDAVVVELQEAQDFRLYLVVPVENGFAPLGLIHKFISPKTIIARIGEAVQLAEGGIYAYVKDGVLYKENR